MSEPVRSVAVLGDGVPAAMAALAVARAFGRMDVAVTWVERGAPIPAHAAYAAPPDLRTFHRLLGIDDAALFGATPATLNAGQQFVGWSGGDAAFLHAYGDAGSAFRSLPFVQYWTRARHAGLRVALEDFCLAAVAAKQGRTSDAPRSAGRQAVQLGYHLDAAAYAALLRDACRQAGVRIVRDPQAAAVCDPHQARVAAITLTGGETIAAELFVDADGALIDAIDDAPADPREPFCDRILRASSPPFTPPPLFSRVTAHAAGWMTLIPLRDRTAIEFAYSSARMTDAEAADALARDAPAPITGCAAPQPIASGARRRFWVGNCVAVGSTVGEIAPLDAAPLLALQLAIGQLVLLWPIDRAAMPEAAIYNEEMAGQRARIADFTALHFRLNAREGETFWDAARAAPISPELSAKIALFAARGMFAHHSHEAHVEDGWALCMTGHGLVPRSSDPQAERVDDAALMAEFQRQLQAIARDVGDMEPHASTLARLAAAKP